MKSSGIYLILFSLFVMSCKQHTDAITMNLYYTGENGSARRFVEEMESSGTISVYTKKEQSGLLKKKERLNNFLGGIKEMKKLPDAVFVVDPLEEHNAVAEARKLHIPVFALIDTNADPNTVDYPIPANDDAAKSIEYITGVLCAAIQEGLNERKLEKEKEVEVAPAEEKPAGRKLRSRKNAKSEEEAVEAPVAEAPAAEEAKAE